jgi:hypothetical protein
MISNDTNQVKIVENNNQYESYSVCHPENIKEIYDRVKMFSITKPTIESTKKPISTQNALKNVQIMLETNYPIRYVIVHAVLTTLFSIICIIIQIVMISQKSPYYTIGSGIWVGIFVLIAVLFPILLSK